jgi:hypothetical protein
MHADKHFSSIESGNIYFGGCQMRETIPKMVGGCCVFERHPRNEKGNDALLQLIDSSSEQLSSISAFASTTHSVPARE